MVRTINKPEPENQDGNETDGAGLEQLVDVLRSDPALEVFLSDNFPIHKHVGTAIRQHRIQSALEEAQRASSLLTSNVRQEVIRRKEVLLAEVDAVDVLEKEVQNVSAGVGNLVNATNGLSDKLSKPIEPMQRAMRRLTNLTATADLLRAVGRFRHCTAKLEAAGLFPDIGPVSASTSTNLPIAAEALRELEQLTSSSGPTGLDKVEGISREIIAVRKSSPEVRKRAAAMLKSGLATRTQIDVEAAVLVFKLVNVLSDRVNAEVARLLRETQTAVHRGLEAPHGKVSTSAVSSEANDVWANIEKMLDVVAGSCAKVVLLQQVLSRKYCDVTHMSFLHDTIASKFIDSVSRTIAEQVAILSRTGLQRSAAAYVFLALAEGYPRLRGALKDTAKRVSSLARVSPTPITKFASSATLPLIPDHEFIQRQFLQAFVEVETHYLTASLERLTKTVNAFFEDGKQPGETQALMFAKMLASELSAARSDKQLFRTAVGNVSTAIRLYASQAQDYAAANVPSSDMNGKALGETEKWHLTTTYNGMVTLHTSACRVLGEREDGSGPIPTVITKELSTLSQLSGLLLDGPFSMCKSNIRAAVKRMHTEDLEGEAGDDGCSFYVLDIAAQLSMFADGIIPSLARSRTLGTYTLKLAKWVLDVLSLHVGLVFPQSKAVKIRLSTDMARIELAVETLCAARLLGDNYRAFRALRSSLLLPTESLLDMGKGVSGELAKLKASTLAHMIFGRTTDGRLLHPHRRQSLTPDEYVTWLLKHSEEEAWKEVELSLGKYAGSRREDEKESIEYKTVNLLCRRLIKMQQM